MIIGYCSALRSNGSQGEHKTSHRGRFHQCGAVAKLNAPVGHCKIPSKTMHLIGPIQKTAARTKFQSRHPRFICNAGAVSEVGAHNISVTGNQCNWNLIERIQAREVT